MAGRWNWRSAALCRTSDAEDLFVTGAPSGRPELLPRLPGPHRVPRARAGPAHRVRGLGRDDRAGAPGSAARPPEVRSWAELLADARAAHYASDADETADALAAADHEAGERWTESA